MKLLKRIIKDWMSEGTFVSKEQLRFMPGEKHSDHGKIWKKKTKNMAPGIYMLHTSEGLVISM